MITSATKDHTTSPLAAPTTGPSWELSRDVLRVVVSREATNTAAPTSTVAPPSRQPNPPSPKQTASSAVRGGWTALYSTSVAESTKRFAYARKE